MKRGDDDSQEARGGRRGLCQSSKARRWEVQDRLTAQLGREAQTSRLCGQRQRQEEPECPWALLWEASVWPGGLTVDPDDGAAPDTPSLALVTPAILQGGA